MDSDQLNSKNLHSHSFRSWCLAATHLVLRNLFPGERNKNANVKSFTKGNPYDAFEIHHLADESTPIETFQVPMHSRYVSSIRQHILNPILAARLLDVPVPRILSWDDSPENSLRKPYIIQTKPGGTRLDLLMPTLTLNQKIDLAIKLANYYQQIMAHTFSAGGILHSRQFVQDGHAHGSHIGALTQSDVRICSYPFHYLDAPVLSKRCNYRDYLFDILHRRKISEDGYSNE
jgi:hypothetical protein